MGNYLKLNKRLIIVLFLLPSILGFLIFSLIPCISSLYLSLTDYDGLHFINEANFIGLTNFINILKDPKREIWIALRNTLYFIVLYIPLILITSIGMAKLLSSDHKGIKVFRLLYYIPVLTSWVAGSLIWKSALSKRFGVINLILSYFGISGPAWMQNQYWAMPGIVLASIWKDVGFFSLIFLGGLKSINTTYYEAADVDGATAWQKFTKITLPLLSPTTFLIAIMCIINSFQLFPQVMVMTDNNGVGPNGATQVMVERIYKYAFRYFKMGYSSAYSWILFIIIFGVTILQFKLQKKWVNYDA